MRLETGYLKFEIGLRRLHRVGFGKLKVGSWIALLLGIATLAGNGEALLRLARNAVFLRNSWQARGYRSSGDYIDLPRQMVERHVAPDASVFFACIHSNRLLAVERSQHLAVSWAMCPTPVPFGYDPAIGDADAVLACAYGPGPEFESAGLEPGSFEKVDEGGGRALWLRRDRARASPSAGRVGAPSPARELAGLAAPLLVATAGALTAGWGGALFGLLLFSIGMAIPPLAGFRPSPLFVVAASALCIAGVRGSRRWLRDAPATPGDDARRRRRVAVAAGLLFAVLAGALALSHTFVAPNGPGVSGGRAKLLYLSSGVPDGFFTDPARSTLQPAYPPGFALLTLGCYGLAGGCGEWLTQLLGVAAMASALAFLCGRLPSRPAQLWALMAFLSPLGFRLASLYYAEPLLALFILVGWERVRKGGGDAVGWLLIGASGWFKNEGLVYLLALWVAMRLIGGAKSARWTHLLAAAALPALWHVGCRLCGAALDDFAPLWQPDFEQAWTALRRMAGYAFAEPWRYAFAYPAATFALAGPPSLCKSPLKAAGVAALVAFAAFAGIFALSASPDFAWHLDSAERLLWIPALVLLRELADAARGGGNRSVAGVKPNAP